MISHKQNYLKTEWIARGSNESSITRGMQGKFGHFFMGILYKETQQKLDELAFEVCANAEASWVCT